MKTKKCAKRDWERCSGLVFGLSLVILRVYPRIPGILYFVKYFFRARSHKKITNGPTPDIIVI